MITLTKDDWFIIVFVGLIVIFTGFIMVFSDTQTIVKYKLDNISCDCHNSYNNSYTLIDYLKDMCGDGLILKYAGDGYTINLECYAIKEGENQ